MGWACGDGHPVHSLSSTGRRGPGRGGCPRQ
jgi:hypothetical protein